MRLAAGMATDFLAYLIDNTAPPGPQDRDSHLDDQAAWLPSVNQTGSAAFSGTVVSQLTCHRWAGDQSGFDPTQLLGGVSSTDADAKRADYQRAQSEYMR